MLAGRLIFVDDCENIVCEGKTPGNGSEDPMGQTARPEQHQNVDLLCKNWASRCKMCKTWVNKCRMALRLKVSEDKMTARKWKRR